MNVLTSRAGIENSIHKFSPASGREIPQNQECKDVEEIAKLFGDSLNNDKESRMSELEKLIMDSESEPFTQERKDCINGKAEIIVKCASDLHMTVSEFKHSMGLLRIVCNIAEKMVEEKARF